MSAGGTPEEIARRFLQGGLRERAELATGPLRQLLELRLRLAGDAPARQAFIRSLSLAHEDATSAVVLADGEVEGAGSISGPVTLERRDGAWRVLDYSPFGVRTLTGLLSWAPSDAQPGARATVPLLYRGAAGTEGEVRIANSGVEELVVREVWLGARRRWARALVGGATRVAAGAETSLVVARAARRPHESLVVFTSREPFVLDLRSAGSHDVPRSLRWARSRWRVALQSFVPALAAWLFFGGVAAIIVGAGLLLLVALGRRYERSLTSVTGSEQANRSQT